MKVTNKLTKKNIKNKKIINFNSQHIDKKSQDIKKQNERFQKRQSRIKQSTFTMKQKQIIHDKQQISKSEINKSSLRKVRSDPKFSKKYQQIINAYESQYRISESYMRKNTSEMNNLKSIIPERSKISVQQKNIYKVKSLEPTQFSKFYFKDKVLKQKQIQNLKKKKRQIEEKYLLLQKKYKQALLQSKDKIIQFENQKKRLKQIKDQHFTNQNQLQRLRQKYLNKQFEHKQKQQNCLLNSLILSKQIREVSIQTENFDISHQHINFEPQKNIKNVIPQNKMFQSIKNNSFSSANNDSQMSNSKSNMNNTKKQMIQQRLLKIQQKLHRQTNQMLKQYEKQRSLKKVKVIQNQMKFSKKKQTAKDFQKKMYSTFSQSYLRNRNKSQQSQQKPKNNHSQSNYQDKNGQNEQQYQNQKIKKIIHEQNKIIEKNSFQKVDQYSNATKKFKETLNQSRHHYSKKLANSHIDFKSKQINNIQLKNYMTDMKTQNNSAQKSKNNNSHLKLSRNISQKSFKSVKKDLFNAKNTKQYLNKFKKDIRTQLQTKNKIIMPKQDKKFQNIQNLDVIENDNSIRKSYDKLKLNFKDSPVNPHNQYQQIQNNSEHYPLHHIPSNKDLNQYENKYKNEKIHKQNYPRIRIQNIKSHIVKPQNENNSKHAKQSKQQPETPIYKIYNKSRVSASQNSTFSKYKFKPTINLNDN